MSIRIALGELLETEWKRQKYPFPDFLEMPCLGKNVVNTYLPINQSIYQDRGKKRDRDSKNQCTWLWGLVEVSLKFMGQGVSKGRSWSDRNPHRPWLRLLSQAIRKGRSCTGKIHYGAIMLGYGLGECLSLLLKSFCWLSQVHQDSVSYLEPMDWNFNYFCIIHLQQRPG